MEKAAIVTGGASGIGKAAVALLLAQAWRVIIADRDQEAGRAAERALTNDGARVRFVAVDVAEEASVQAMVESCLQAFGRLDGAINSAGVGQAGKSIRHMEASEWDRGHNINLRGMFFCLKHQIDAMWGNQAGSIVAISSLAATKGLINSSDYCSAKAGITGLVRGAAMDTAERGIRVNAILPGATETPMATRSTTSTPGLAGTLRRPMGRMAQPAEVASMAVWLLGDEATYVTGSSIAVDGGMAIA